MQHQVRGPSFHFVSKNNNQFRFFTGCCFDQHHHWVHFKFPSLPLLELQRSPVPEVQYLEPISPNMDKQTKQKKIKNVQWKKKLKSWILGKISRQWTNNKTKIPPKTHSENMQIYFAGLCNLVIGFNIFESKFLEICKLDQTLFGAFKGQLCFHSDKHTITKKVIL